MPFHHLKQRFQRSCQNPSEHHQVPSTSDAESDQQEEQLVVIDTDAGTDDAWGLFMAIRAHRDPSHPVRIVAITTVHGNTKVENVNKNVTRTLQTAGETGIPVYAGAAGALAVPLNLDEPPYHGEDGFGDADLPPIEPILAEGHAANVLGHLAKEHPGALTVIALGPLTNLALAIRLNPDINFRQIFIMGGNINAVGNTTATGEYNFLGDTEAAKATLESYKCPIMLAPWETGLQYGTATKTYRIDNLGSLATPQMGLLNKVEAKILETSPGDTWHVPDPVPIAWFLNPAFAIKKETHYCTVELGGTHTRGMMVVDRIGALQEPTNVTFITEFDLEVFKRMLAWGAGGSPY